MVGGTKYMRCGTFSFGIYSNKHITPSVLKILLCSPGALGRVVTALQDAKEETKVVTLP